MTAPSDADQQAEHALAELAQITDSKLTRLPLDDLLPELLDRIVRIIGADTAAFLLLDEGSRALEARAARGIEEEVQQRVRVPLGRGFAGRVALERRPITIPDVDRYDIFNPILREKGIRSLLGVPLLVDGRPIGVLHVGTLTPREFTARDIDLLQVAAERAATAIEQARLLEQRRAVAELQRALLPDPLPPIAGFDLAARYVPAAVGTSIGGDWYDAFDVGSGCVAVVIGDVMGRGVSAAALMAQLRTAVRAYALDGHPPVGVVERLNRLLARLRPTRMTTLCYLVVDPERETLRVVSAGHLPPLLVLPDGSASYLEVEGDPPLGVASSTAFAEHAFAMPEGSTVVLVTDGAVEVRGESIDRGLERLRTLGAGVPDVARLCAAVIRGDVTGRPPDDDVAVLALRLSPIPERLRATWPADTETLGSMRHLLRRWLAGRGGVHDEIFDITVAVQEACANAVEHAYIPGPSAYEVDAACEEGTVTVVVRDHGRWREPRPGSTGHGLPLMRALMDEVELERGEHGTVVTLRRRLGRL